MDKYIGKRLDGRYEIQEIIGIGGMAVVYKAHDSIEDRTVAVKILKEELLENQEFRRRFKNESKAIAVLSHPNIVKVFDVGLGDRIQYIVMEHIDGITLKEYIKSQQTMRWKDALHFAEQVLRALQHAHDKGIVHRDIKPQNMILLPNGTIKVTDFGIARFSRSERHTKTDKAIGSVHYISPEQARGEMTDEKTDLYSVGVLLYEMLTGRLPFDAENAVSVAIMQLQNEPTKPRALNPAIPEGLEEIILRAMQKNPARRYQSAAEMLQDIAKFKQNPSVQFEYKYFVDSEPTKFVDVANTNSSDGDDEPKKSSALPILVGITVAVALIVGGFLVWIGGSFMDLWGTPTSTSECPELVGKVYNEVIADDAYKEYKIVIDEKEYSTKYAAGVIMYQTPEAGKTLKGKKEITVKISLGSKSQVMEDFKNYDVESATNNLDKMNIKYKVIQTFSDEISSGFIIATDPPAGTPIKPDTQVQIYVSKGPLTKFVKVSDYVGLTEAVAKRMIEGDGLTIGRITKQENDKYPPGYVVSQSVAANSTVDNGSSIDLVISNGKSIYIYLPIPDDAQKPFTITVHHNNNLIQKGGQVDPNTLAYGSSGKRELLVNVSRPDNISSSVTSIVLKYDNVPYMEYRVNFNTGEYAKVNEYILPNDVLVAPPTPSVDSSVAETTNNSSSPAGNANNSSTTSR